MKECSRPVRLDAGWHSLHSAWAAPVPIIVWYSVPSPCVARLSWHVMQLICGVLCTSFFWKPALGLVMDPAWQT